MDNKELNEKIAQVIELADAEKQQYVKEDLVLFAKTQIENGNDSPDYILSHFFDENIF
jgi:hypothetical protein